MIPNKEIDDFISHYGVRGMRWGVRKDGTPHTRRSAKKEAKADKKWGKQIYSVKGAVAVHNNVAEKMNNGGLAKLNNSKPYRGKNLYHDPALMDRYMQDYERLSEKFYREAINEIHGTSPSGNLRAQYINDADGERIEIKEAKVRHAEEDEAIEIVISVKRDDFGRVVEVNKAEGSAMDHSDLGKEFLEHYGVKGMRWGVRKRSASEDRARGKKFKKENLSEDSDKVNKLRGKGVHELSNKELQAINERMNLEQNYSRLNPGKMTRGQQGVQEVIKVATTGATLYNLYKSPAGQAAIAVGKKIIIGR